MDESTIWRLFRYTKVGAPEECWIWTGAKSWGYGSLHVQGRKARATRLWYEFFFGPVDPDLIMCHHCDTPPCVNPWHLFPATYKENTQDALAKGRMLHGSKNGMVRLREEDVLIIRELHRSGMKQKDIALRFCTSRGNISLIVNRKHWKHLP